MKYGYHMGFHDGGWRILGGDWSSIGTRVIHCLYKRRCFEKASSVPLESLSPTSLPDGNPPSSAISRCRALFSRTFIGSLHRSSSMPAAVPRNLLEGEGLMARTKMSPIVDHDIEFQAHK